MPTLSLSWTSASVPAGDSLVEHIAIPEGAEIEILKTKVTASTDLGTSEFFIFRKTTALDADRALATAEWPNSSPFVHPIEDNAGVTAERTLGYPLLYIDESASGSTHRLHVKYTNNSSVAATYDCVVTYRVPLGAVILPTTLTNFSDRSLWVPLYHPKTTLTFNADGTMSVFNVSGDDNTTGRSAFAGIMSRFKLYPDSTGVLKIRSKFTDYEDGAASGIESALGMILEQQPGSYRRFEVVDNGDARQVVRTGLSSWASLGGADTSTYIDPEAANLEFEVTIANDETVTAQYRLTTFRYKDAAGNWQTMGISGSVLAGPQFLGARVFLGISNFKLKGLFGAKLAEFAVENGIIVPG
jgi:hypothetical protein